MIRLCAFADEADEMLVRQIEALKRNGISLIELRSVNGKNVSELTDEEAIEVKDMLSENGISVWSVGSPLGKVNISEAEAHMQKVRRVCELAKILNAGRIRMFSFFEAYEKSDAVKKYLTEMCEIAGEYGVSLCHENEKEVYGDTLERVLELADAKIEGLRFVFDPANYIQCGIDVGEALDCLFDKTAYFHIKDVIAETSELVPAGVGDGKIDQMIARIKESGRDAVLTLEPHLKLFAGYGAIDNTVLQTKYQFATNDESFDAAVTALKGLLVAGGYTEKENEKGEKVWQV